MLQAYTFVSVTYAFILFIALAYLSSSHCVYLCYYF